MKPQWRAYQKPAVEAMRVLTGSIALEHHGLHVVIQHFARHAAKVFECVIMARDQRLDFHVGDEFDKAHAAEAQRRAKCIQWVFTLAELDPVHLHLLARSGLESHYRLYR